MIPRHRNALLIATLGVFAALAVGIAATRAPWWDESWFTDEAWNLAAHGNAGTSLLTGTAWLPHIERYTYWVMPLYPVVLAGWIKLLGLGLVRVRLLSVLWGVIGLVAWAGVLESLTASTGVALLGVVFIGFDASWLALAADGRMDAMAAALGFTGYAVFLRWRTAGFARAFLWANVAVACAVFTHPFGITAFAGLWILAWTLDRESLRMRTLWPAVVPYAIGAAAWGAYILRSPRDFLAQFGQNSSDHMAGLAGLVRLFAREPDRFVRFYTSGTLAEALRAVPLPQAFHGALPAVPLAFAAAAIAALVAPALRRRADVRVLFAMGAVALLLCTVLDVRKRYYYLVYVVPPFAALAAVVVAAAWSRWPRARAGVAAVVVAIAVIDAGAASDTMRADSLRADWQPAVQFLAAHATARDRVVGSGEVAYALGFDRPIVDDQTLGVASGVRADWIVMSSRYDLVLNDPASSPALRDSIRHRLNTGYERVYADDEYRIYRRIARPPARIAAAHVPRVSDPGRSPAFHPPAHRAGRPRLHARARGRRARAAAASR